MIGMSKQSDLGVRVTRDTNAWLIALHAIIDAARKELAPGTSSPACAAAVRRATSSAGAIRRMRQTWALAVHKSHQLTVCYTVQCSKC